MAAKRGKHATEADIAAFMEAVYPGAGQLALGSFCEQAVLHDAMECINALRKQVSELLEHSVSTYQCSPEGKP